MWEAIQNFLPRICPFANFIDYLNNSQSTLAGFLRTFNWFVPIADMIGILQVWVAAIGAWYAVTIILRNLRAIQ
jgi:hypothetical protein